MSSQCDTVQMCNRTDCAGVWAGELACSVCEEGEMGSSCVICNNSMADEITLHYTSDGWDTPFRVCLCRDHQAELISPVQEAVEKMRKEREVANG